MLPATSLQLGGNRNARLRILDGRTHFGAHGVTDPAFEEIEMYEWLLRQSRSGPPLLAALPTPFLAVLTGGAAAGGGGGAAGVGPAVSFAIGSSTRALSAPATISGGGGGHQPPRLPQQSDAPRGAHSGAATKVSSTIGGGGGGGTTGGRVTRRSARQQQQQQQQQHQQQTEQHGGGTACDVNDANGGATNANVNSADLVKGVATMSLSAGTWEFLDIDGSWKRFVRADQDAMERMWVSTAGRGDGTAPTAVQLRNAWGSFNVHPDPKARTGWSQINLDTHTHRQVRRV